MRLDIESESRIDLREHAHELKGTAATFGFFDIYEITEQLKTQADVS